MLLTLKPEREIALFLRRANALEKERTNRLEFDAVIDELEVVRRRGYSMSLGTAQAGAAGLAILLPVPREQTPLTLSVGGPIKEIHAKKQRLVEVLRRAVEHLRRAAER